MRTGPDQYRPTRPETCAHAEEDPLEPSELPETAALRAYSEQLQQKFSQMVEQAPALVEKARAVQVTEKSKDGLVTVTVGPRGDLVRLDLDPRIYRRPDSRELADTITATVQKAIRKARDQVVETFESIIPPEQMRATVEGDLDGMLGAMNQQIQGR